MLTATDPLVPRPRRILVAGVSGSGKTTLCARLGRALMVPHHEIDGLFHGPNWQPRHDFIADVERLAAGERWTTEWQYAVARPVLAARADTLVWLDVPFRQTLSQVTRRTVRRRRHREKLWNGNQEGPLWGFFTDREHIIRWAISTRRKYGPLVAEAERDFPQLRVVRLTSNADIETWLAHVERLGS